MKDFLLSLISVFFFFSVASAQDFGSKSKQELEQMKVQAVEEQDFELAAKIKSELQSRKSIDDQITEKQEQLNKVIDEGDFARASELKKEIEQLKKSKAELDDLESKLKIAVEEENYVEAQRLKQQIEELKRNPGNTVPKVVEKTPVDKAPENTDAKPAKINEVKNKKERGGSFYKITAGLTFGDAVFKSDDQSNDINQYGSKVGFLLAVSQEYPLWERFSLQATVGLTNIGLKTTQADYSYRMTYFTTRITGIYKFPFQGFLSAGTFVDFGLMGTQTMPSGNEHSIFEEEIFNKWNAGIVGEAGYLFDIKVGMTAEVFLAYRIGLTDIEGKYDSDNQKALLRMFTIGGRYHL